MRDAKQASTMGFSKKWLHVWDGYNQTNLNLYIIVDPAGSVKKRADFTTMWVIGCGSDKNYYILDLIRDKFDLTGKANTLFSLVRKYTRNTRKPIVYYIRFR